MTNVFKSYFTPLAIIIGGVLIAGTVLYTNGLKSSGLTLQAAGERAIDFINQNIEENVTASLIEMTDVGSGVYKIHLKINETGQEYESYITKDGNFLFPSGADIKDFTPQNQPPSSPEAAVPATSLDAFVQCLSDKGMKFYGSRNCSWCAQEKALFGDSLQYLSYVECIDDDGQWTEACREAQIEAVPTWQLPDGQREPGYKTLEQLAEESGCQLQ